MTVLRDTLFSAALLEEFEARAPAVFRADENYQMAQLVRPLNAFTRDTVHALQTIAAAMDAIAEEIENLSDAIDSVSDRVTTLESTT